MSYEEFARIDERFPYVLEYEAGDGRLLIVGIAHTLDPDSDTITRIWSEWERFRPTLAFYEGWGRPMGATREIVGRHGEPAVVRFLAYTSRVPVTSPEPDLGDEIEHLRKSWNDEQIRLFYTLRFVAEGIGYGGRASSDADVAEFLSGGFPPTIGGPPRTIQEPEVSVCRYFPEGTDWRKAPAEWFEPSIRGIFTNRMAASSGRYRDEYMLPRLVERARRGDRVFVALGYSHAYMLEPALTAALGPPVLENQGNAAPAGNEKGGVHDEDPK